MKRGLVALGIALIVATVAWALFLPDRVVCASLGYPEGIPCPHGRIEFKDHGSFVSVGVDRRLSLRVGIASVGLVTGVGLILVGARPSRWGDRSGDTAGYASFHS